MSSVKVLLFIASFLLLLIGLTRAQTAADVAGDWTGTLEVGSTQLRLVFHIANDNGSLSATLDSPDQGASGIPVSSTTFAEGKIEMVAAGIGGRYSGTLDPAGKRLSGTWSQGGQRLALTLFKIPATDAGATPFKGSDFAPLLGIWQGKIPVGSLSLRLVLHFEKTASGKLKAYLDSPDQGATGIGISEVILEGNQLTVKANGIGATFSGVLDPAQQTLAGTWQQGGGNIALTLERTDEAVKINRPQEPKAPLPYRSEEVGFLNTRDDIELAGTLTLPRGKGPFPAVILISGSGPQDRDESLLGHKPFLIIADRLTRSGIAVLRYDDRGFGASQGNFSTATSEDFSFDAAAALDYLKTREDIRPDAIGFAGHSEGGIIAPMVAARRQDVAYLVLMAGTGMKGIDILRLQQGLILRAEGYSEALIRAETGGLDSLYHILTTVADPDVQAREILALHHRIKARASESVQAEMDKMGTTDAQVEQSIRTFQSPWFRYFLSYDPLPSLKKVACPVLAINGEKDLQVPPRENLAAIEKALRDAGNKGVTVREFPQLNHLFQHAQSGAPSEYATLEETFSEEVLTFMKDWILKTIGGV
ncbi:MAG: alpha/beta fold hydrolase [Calditrichaeota bacterium]|nr:alpha/beta fold hydrolase [Calditrichota bacterium]